MMNLIKNRRVWQLIIALILVMNLFSVAAPVQASNSNSSCSQYYLIQYGDTLYKIGVRFGISWPDIASANGIGYPYTIYYGTYICIPTGGSSYNYYGNTTSSGGIGLYVSNVKINNKFKLTATNLPKHEDFHVNVGKCDYSTPKNVGEIVTDGDSGTFADTFAIPSKYEGVSCLVVYLDSQKTTRFASTTFTNAPAGTVYPVLKFSISGVTKNKNVTIHLNNVKKGQKYSVFVGKYGTGAYPYTLVKSFTASKSEFSLTVKIPAAYKNQAKLDIRVEGVTIATSLYHSFKNKTQ
jgi:LysM repeat protein